jgi:hypothetical protein
VSRGGRDSIDHPPGGHDDLINAAAIALVMVLRKANRPRLALINTGFDGTLTREDQEEFEEEERQARLRESADEIAESLIKKRFWWPHDDEPW